MHFRAFEALKKAYEKFRKIVEYQIFVIKAFKAFKKTFKVFEKINLLKLSKKLK